MKCKNCGTEINDGDKFCKNCGVKITEKEKDHKSSVTKTIKKESSNEKEKQKFSWKKDSKKVIFAIIALLIFIAIIILVNDSFKVRSDAKNTKTTLPVTLSIKEENIKILCNATNLSKDKASLINTDLENVGIDELISCKLSTKSGDSKVYNFQCKKCTGKLKIKGYKTLHIVAGNKNLYTAKDGLINNINEYYLSSSEKRYFASLTKEYIKEYLKAPSTADFPELIGEWDIDKCQNNVTIKSHVDSQNSFGAMIRSNFICQITYDTEDVIYVSIDGVNMLGTYQSSIS